MPKQKNLLKTVDDTQDEIKKWWGRVDLAKQERKTHETKWDAMIEAYKPTFNQNNQPEELKTNIHFRNVHQKISQLFFKRPEINLFPKDSISGVKQDPVTGEQIAPENAIKIHEAVIDAHMDETVNLPLLMDRVLFDCLCPSGLMVTKIGYQAYTDTVQQPQMDIQEVPMPTGGVDMLGQPEIVPQMQEMPVLDEQGQPVMEDVPVIVKEEYFWTRVSPKQVLIPEDFHDTDYEKAPWLGIEFKMPLREAKRLYNLGDDFEGKQGDTENRLLGENRTDRDRSEKTVSGVEIFYKARTYRKDVIHPDIYYQLVLIGGQRENGKMVSAIHRQSPYQEIDPNTMQLTASSMLGNSIHIGTIRDLSDSAYVPSDVAMTHTQVKEIDTYRRQTIKLRDANLVKYAYDTSAVTPDALQSMKDGDVGQWIAFEGGKMAQGIESIIAPINPGGNARIDQEGAFLLAQDVEKAMAIGSNQSGGVTDTARTATELSLVQSNANVRLEKEQTRVLQYVIAGIRKYDSLLQQFADATEVIGIVGEDGVRRLQSWDKNVIAGRHAYDVKLDSQLRLDMAQERNQWMQMYNLTAQDPFNNRQESLKKLQRLFGIDPVKGMQTPPEPGPPPPSVTTRFGGQDIAGPAAQIVIEILEQAGYQFSPEAKELAITLGAQAMLLDQQMQQQDPGQPGVPGPAERLPAIDKGQGETTGNMPSGGGGFANDVVGQ